MIIRKSFICKEDNNGFTGWVMSTHPDFDASINGFTIAHDFLEHMDKSASVESELMAFGAIFRGRVMGDYWGSFVDHPRRGVIEMLADDVASFVCREIDNIEIYNRRVSKVYDDEYSDEFEELLKQLKEKLFPSFVTELAYCDAQVNVELLIQWCLSYIVKGYNKAAKRYQMNSFNLTCLFDNIAKALDDEHLFTDPVIGNVMYLSADTVTGEYNIKFKYRMGW